MMQNNDLISRSALLEALDKLYMAALRKTAHSVETIYELDHLAMLVKDAPSVDAEPVRHERWEPVIRYDVFGKPFTAEHTCSICKEEALCCRANYDAEEELSNYCPSCGAKMDAEVEG